MRSIVFAMFLALHSAPALQETMIVERSRVGPVVLGATAESIYQEFGDRARLIDLKLEGMLSPALELKLFGAQLVASLIAEIGPVNNRLVVTRIRVVIRACEPRTASAWGPHTWNFAPATRSTGSGRARGLSSQGPKHSASASNSTHPVRSRCGQSAIRAKCRRTFASWE